MNVHTYIHYICTYIHTYECTYIPVFLPGFSYLVVHDLSSLLDCLNNVVCIHKYIHVSLNLMITFL